MKNSLKFALDALVQGNIKPFEQLALKLHSQHLTEVGKGKILDTDMVLTYLNNQLQPLLDEINLTDSGTYNKYYQALLEFDFQDYQDTHRQYQIAKKLFEDYNIELIKKGEVDSAGHLKEDVDKLTRASYKLLQNNLLQWQTKLSYVFHSITLLNLTLLPETNTKQENQLLDTLKQECGSCLADLLKESQQANQNSGEHRSLIKQQGAVQSLQAILLQPNKAVTEKLAEFKQKFADIKSSKDIQPNSRLNEFIKNITRALRRGFNKKRKLNEYSIFSKKSLTEQRVSKVVKILAPNTR